MPKIFIIEDNIFQREKVVKSVQKFIFKEKEANYEIHSAIYDPKIILQQYTPSTTIPNIFFIDIDLKLYMNGIDLAESLRKIDPNAYIVFITNLKDKVTAVVRRQIAPIDYIVKDDHSLENRVCFILSEIFRRERIKNQDEKSYLFGNSIEFKKVLYKHITYFEALPRAKKVLLHTLEGEYIINKYLSEIKNEFMAEESFLILKSFVINLNKITSVKKPEGEITFFGGEVLYVGKRIIDKVLYALKEKSYEKKYDNVVAAARKSMVNHTRVKSLKEAGYFLER